jgi:hypothetical protein
VVDTFVGQISSAANADLFDQLKHIHISILTDRGERGAVLPQRIALPIAGEIS